MVLNIFLNRDLLKECFLMQQAWTLAAYCFNTICDWCLLFQKFSQNLLIVINDLHQIITFWEFADVYLTVIYLLF